MNLINNEKQLEQSPVCTGRGVVGLICHFIASYVAFLSSSHNKLAQPQKKKTKNKTACSQTAQYMALKIKSLLLKNFQKNKENNVFF